ncbi:uncharacterized protein LOC129717229 [Wyeomyia smithii]|uniref:uncharacterized protein LOC129717229 n=1 Tax=Wyeomyia smithii TaxID=174621 RepID=UPI002467BD7C|nr:uncharacterized protein LOC129717229 [Wyeomyia smithii]
MKLQRVYVDWNRCWVQEDVNVNRCYNCSAYGHKASTCDKPPCCPKCAGDHKANECEADFEKCSRPGPSVVVGDGISRGPFLGKYALPSTVHLPDSFSRFSSDEPTISSVPLPDSSCQNHSIPKLTTHDIDANVIHAYYQNVRGLRTKLDDLLLASSDCNYDIIMLTETGLDDCIDSLQLFGSAYNVYRCDRSASNSNKSSFGGVLIAVAQKFCSSAINLNRGSCLEQVCVSAVIKGTKLLLTAVYIPPDRSKIVRFIDEHILSMRELCDKGSLNDRVLICGDYNQPQISWFNGENGVQCDSSLPLHVASAAVIDGFEFLNLKQVNTLRNNLGRILDLVYCLPEQEISVHLAIAPLLPVDPPHPPLELILPIPACSVDVPAASVGMAPHNYRRINFDALAGYLSALDWVALLDELDVDDMTLRFCDAICSWLDDNLPRTRPPKVPAWGNGELRRLKRYRNARQRLLRKQRTLFNRRAFKYASDAYRRLNSSLYKSYVLRTQFSLRSNPKSFWTFVNSKRKSTSIPSSVFLGGTDSSTVTESCELFADHFSSVFANGCTTQSEAELAAAGVPVGAVDMDIFEITPAMVIAGAKKLKSSYWSRRRSSYYFLSLRYCSCRAPQSDFY